MTEEQSRDDILRRLERIKNAPPGTGVDGREVILDHLDHEDDEIRALAVSCTWDYPGKEVAGRILELAENDPDSNVRINTIKAMGRYMHEGAMEMFESEDGPWEDAYTEHAMTMDQYERMRDFLLDLFRDRGNASLEERRYALESLSFLHREEVREFIKEGFQSDHSEMKQSALFAMSRTKSGEWSDQIRESIHHEDDDVRFEAIRAAGECGIESAHKSLLRIAQSTEDRSEFRQTVTAIANLGLQESFMYLDNLDRESRIDVDPEFASNVMDQWMFKNKVRKDMEDMPQLGSEKKNDEQSSQNP